MNAPRGINVDAALLNQPAGTPDRYQQRIKEQLQAGQQRAMMEPQVAQAISGAADIDRAAMANKLLGAYRQAILERVLQA